MADLTEQDISFADSAPCRPEGTALVDGTPAEVWAVLADHERWPEWFGNGVTEVTPTSGSPFGVGSTRRVKLGSRVTVDERFIAWDEGELFAFTGASFSPGAFRALVERATIEPVDESRTRVTYRMAFTPHPLLKPLAPLLVKKISASLQAGMAGLAREVAARR